jgi:hypothetical protein
MKPKLIAQIVRVVDGTRVGSIDLSTGDLATDVADLSSAWERLRTDSGLHLAGTRVAGHGREGVEPLLGNGLSAALIALRARGFDWRVDGTRKRRG